MIDETQIQDIDHGPDKKYQATSNNQQDTVMEDLLRIDPHNNLVEYHTKMAIT